MKVVIPVQQDKRTIDNFFGRAPYFAVYDSETRAIEFSENPASQCESGVGTRAAQSVVDLHAERLGLPQCGKNAQDVLEAAGVTLYQTKDTDLETNLEALAAGTLTELKEAHPGFNWGN